MDGNIYWLGHSAFRITGQGGHTIIYIDPFRIAGGPVADYILITHGHHDHCSPEDVRKIHGEHTITLAPQDCLSRLPGETRAMCAGDTLRLPGVEDHRGARV